MVLEDALKERSEPLKRLLVPCMQTACYWRNELPRDLFPLFYLHFVSQQLLYDVLEHCSCKRRVNIGQSDTDHLVCLFVFWDLIDEAVGEALCECAHLFLIETQQEGEEDIGKVDVELCLISL